MFYYCWISGEALIYSFVGIGLVCWYNRWYKRAAIFISLAGTLNMTILSLGIFMIFEYVFFLLRQKEKKETWPFFIKRSFLPLVKYGACYSIGLIPLFYFYYQTGYINLIASYKGFFAGKEAVWQRFLAYLFDLSFGIFPYYPIILILGFVLLKYACDRRCLRYIEWFLAFCVLVFLYSSVNRINSGMAGMARYNTWGALILLFAVCLFFGELTKKLNIRKWIKAGFCVNAAILTVIVYSYGMTGSSKTSYVNWTPIAQFVLDKFPSMYEPLHSTFNARTNHKEGGYDYETPIVYMAKDGYVRKVLASEKDRDKLKKLLISFADSGWLSQQINALGKKESYISIPARYQVIKCVKYEIGSALRFDGNNYNAGEYIIQGLSVKEEWGTWTLGNTFEMRLQTDSPKKKLHGRIACSVFNKAQRYRIYVNEEKAAEGTATGEDIEFDFDNPADKLIDVRIVLPDANSPKNLGQSSDARIIALGLRKIIFTEK